MGSNPIVSANKKAQDFRPELFLFVIMFRVVFEKTLKHADQQYRNQQFF